MHRLTSLLHRRAQPVRPPVAPAPSASREGIVETIGAPKPHPRRCLNEGGHKLLR